MKYECSMCGSTWESDEQLKECLHCHAELDKVIVYTIDYRLEKLSNLVDRIDNALVSLEDKVKKIEERLVSLEWGEGDQNYVSLLERVIILEQGE